MRPALALSIVLLTTLTIAGCANRPPKPVVDRVCINQSRMEQFELEYMTKKTAQYLKELGFTPATDNCDVTVSFVKFGAFQGERSSYGFFDPGSGYWSFEGIANVTHKGSVVIEDKSISLRAYKTRQALIDDLASELVELAGDRFQSTRPQ